MQQLTIILTSLGVLATSLLAFLSYLGLFKKMQAEIATVGSFKVLYQEFQGGFAVLGKKFALMEKLMKANFPDKKKEFFGSYQDDPHKIKDQKKMRMSIGLILKTKEDEKRAELFLQNNSEYKIAELPQLNAIKSSFTYKCDLSYMIGARKAYPVIKKYVNSKEYNVKGHIVGGFEHYLPSEGIIYYYFPIDDTVENPTDSKYYMTSFAQPEYKNDASQRKQK